MSKDIASQLLHSSDTRIAEAAKRVFSSSFATAPSFLRSTSTTTPIAMSTATAAANNTATRGKTAGKTGFSSGGTMKPPPVPSLESSNEEEEGKLSSSDRLKRSRERNRMHARKTRQRKKEHMQKLQNRADELKLEQIRLRQVIHEKNTASILVGLFQSDAAAISSGGGGETSDPRVDALLKRRVEDIPDASKIPELPALILPGQHSHGKKKNDVETTTNAATKNDSSNSNSNTTNEHPEEEDGIDYALLGKDRSSCSPAELDKIRRERNRMHAKRTRDRKRIFMEEMEVMIRQLEEENGVLTGHLERMEGTCSGAESSASVGVGAVSSSSSLLQTVSPDFGPVDCPLAAPASAPLAPESHYSYTAATATAAETSASSHPSAPPPQASDTDTSSRGDFLHQINSLLAAAGAFEKRPGSDNINAISCAESDVTASTNNSEHNSLSGEEEEAEEPIGKKRRLEEVLPEMEGNDVPSSVPLSITTTTLL